MRARIWRLTTAGVAAVGLAWTASAQTPGGGGSPSFDEKTPSKEKQPGKERSKPSPEQETPGNRDDRIDLRPKFKAGQQIRYTFETSSDNQVRSEQVPEMDQKQQMKQEIGMLFRVVEASDSSTTLEIVYERVKMSIKSDGFEAEYDSTKPKAQPGNKGRGKQPQPQQKQPGKQAPAGTPAGSNPALPPGSDLAVMDDNELLAKAMEGIAGSVVKVTLDANGNVTGVNAPSSLSGGGNLGSIPGLGGGMGGLGGAGGGGLPGMGGGGSGGGDWLISSPGQSGFARLGEKWSTSSKLGGTLLGDFSMVTKYVLKSAGGGRATVSFDGRIEQESAASPPSGGQGKNQVRGSSYSGKYVWDTELGQLQEMESNQSVSLDGSALGTAMTMTAEQKVKMKRLK